MFGGFDAPQPTTAAGAGSTGAPAATSVATSAPALRPPPPWRQRRRPAPRRVRLSQRAPVARAVHRPGTLTIAQGVDAESMDPYVTTSGASKGMLWTVFDRLVHRDLDLTIQPGLAMSWSTLDDNTWELKLRQGVTVPQRRAVRRRRRQVQLRPIRRSDHQERLRHPAQARQRASTWSTRYTVRVKTTEPFAELIETLASYVEMLPPKAAADRRIRHNSRSGPGRTSSSPGRPTTLSWSRRPARTGAASPR